MASLTDTLCRTTTFFAVLVLTSLLLAACKEDEYVAVTPTQPSIEEQINAARPITTVMI